MLNGDDDFQRVTAANRRKFPNRNLAISERIRTPFIPILIVRFDVCIDIGTHFPPAGLASDHAFGP